MVMNTLKLKPLVKGGLTFLPGMTRLLPEGGGETSSARYCYGVWLKHLTMLWHNGMHAIPDTLAELGPGASLGTGLAAMLSGVRHYRALDVVEHSSVDANLRVFDELVSLFRKRSARPVKGWPDFDPHLDAKGFPSSILTEERLRESLAPARVARIRHAIANPAQVDNDISIRYIAPWSDNRIIQKDSIDLIISHAVLGEVVELEQTYQALCSWLKPGGFMSHQIGLAFAGINGQWNGYWACPEALWTIIKGKRPFVINRQPRSTHIELLKKQDVDIVCLLEDHSEAAAGGIERTQLRAPWQHLSDEDFRCSGLFVQARKTFRTPARDQAVVSSR